MDKNHKPGINHAVTCAICGKRETIFIDERGRYPPDWNYFCKITVNADQSSKYVYTTSGKKIPNSNYDGSAPRTAEYWECDKCFR